MTKEQLYHFIQQHKLAVIATINNERKPESAVVGIAVTPELEIIFDTVNTSRKYQNILPASDISFVIGWDNETTLQYEGVATLLPEGASKYKEVYFTTFPDGRERADTWLGLVHFKVTPTWIRYSSFNTPQVIEEMSF